MNILNSVYDFVAGNRPIQYTEVDLGDGIFRKKYDSTDDMPLNEEIKRLKGKNMSVAEYFEETSKQLTGQNPQKEESSGILSIMDTIRTIKNGTSSNVERNYYQETINDALWEYGDTNDDDCIDIEEYQQMYYSAVTGKTDASDPLTFKANLGSVLLGAIGINIDKIHTNTSLTTEQA